MELICKMKKAHRRLEHLKEGIESASSVQETTAEEAPKEEEEGATAIMVHGASRPSEAGDPENSHGANLLEGVMATLDNGDENGVVGEEVTGQRELKCGAEAVSGKSEAPAEETADAGDIRGRAHRLCREYLHGAWRSAATQELIIRKVSGGLSNLLFYCALPPSLPPQHGEPTRVLLRLYGQIHGENALDGLITESVIFTLLSESERGPRLLGVFPGGRIEEYIPARPLLTQELSDPKLSSLIAEKMAQIHLMNVPINKEPKWLWETMERWMTTIETFIEQKEVPIQFQSMISKLLLYGLREEFQWLKHFLIDVKSPVVFCHNDVQEGNILLRNGEGIFPEYEQQSSQNGISDLEKSKQNNEQQLVIIDFEYCAYNFRGFDFANHMCEWIYDYSNLEHPFFWARPQNYPSKEQQIIFLKSYLLTIQKEQNGVDFDGEYDTSEIDQMLWEIKAFTLASHFFWGLWSVVNATVSKITFDYWAYGENRFEAYFNHKSYLVADEESHAHRDVP